MSTKKIEQWEVERYWEIFSSLANGGTHLNGAQAASVLKNSQLRDDQLERIWDLADVDNDGNLDFEEFCVAMRLIFDLVNGEYADVPATLPDWLVPSSKSHLVAAHSALSGHTSFPSPPPSDSEDDTPGLKDSFDWYMPPASKSKYEAIFSANASSHGTLSFASLQPLYDSLDAVPDTDVRSAWNLVNPSQEERINKFASLAFLHILSQRQEGYRVPRTVPRSLRASFEEKSIEYDVEQVGRRQMEEQERGGGRSGGKARFGEAYLSRIGGKGQYVPKGTDFSKEELPNDWEEVRLKRQLQDLEAKIEKIEGRERGGGKGRRVESNPALVKRELEMLLDYKRKDLREVESGEGKVKVGEGLRGVEEEIGSVKELVEGLEQHWKRREGVLEDLRRQVDEEKRGR